MDLVNPVGLPLLHGEVVQHSLKDVHMQFPSMDMDKRGILHLTNYQVCFVYPNLVRLSCPDSNVQTFDELTGYFSFPHTHTHTHSQVNIAIITLQYPTQ